MLPSVVTGQVQEVEVEVENQAKPEQISNVLREGDKILQRIALYSTNSLSTKDPQLTFILDERYGVYIVRSPESGGSLYEKLKRMLNVTPEQLKRLGYLNVFTSVQLMFEN